MEAYGHECECCGERSAEFLAMDHVYGGGNKHRKTIGCANIYLWLKRHNCPKDSFRILCANCNTSLGHYGYCPHGQLAPLTDATIANDYDPEDT